MASRRAAETWATDPDECPYCGHPATNSFVAPQTCETICAECGTVLPDVPLEVRVREPFNPPVAEGPPRQGAVLAPPPARAGAGSSSSGGRVGGGGAHSRVVKMSTWTTSEESALRKGTDLIDVACRSASLNKCVADCAKEVLTDVMATRKKGTRVSSWAAAALFYGCKLAGFPRKLDEVFAALVQAGLAATQDTREGISYSQLGTAIDTIPQLLHDKHYAAKLCVKVQPLDVLPRVLDRVLMLSAADSNAVRRVLDSDAGRALQKALVPHHQTESVLAGLICWAGTRISTGADLSPPSVAEKMGVTAATIAKVVAKCA